MQGIETRHHFRQTERDLYRSLKGNDTQPYEADSIADSAVRILFEGLIINSGQSIVGVELPSSATCGNVIVLALGEEPKWSSNPHIELPRDLCSMTPSDISGGIYARHITTNQQLYHVLATRLCTHGASELSLLSVSMSDAMHDYNSFDMFARLSTAMRACLPALVRRIDVLKEVCNCDVPFVVTAGESGTVVVASDAFVELSGTTTNIVGQLFLDIMSSIPEQRRARWKMKAIKLSEHNPMLAVTTFAPIGAASDVLNPIEHLIHCSRNRLSSILSASTLLHDHVSSHTADEKELQDIITREAEELGQLLWHVEVLSSQDRDEKHEIEVADAVQSAALGIAQHYPGSRIVISPDVKRCTVLSSAMVSILVNALLRGHGHAQTMSIRSTIHAEQNGQAMELTICSSSSDNASPKTNRIWLAYADAVAAQVGISLHHANKPSQSTFLSRLEIHNITI